jgi:ABC-type Zn uptake system ZnuABC Zn-binding protein ZnuA
MDKEDLFLVFKEGMEYYAQLIREDPKNKERYEPSYFAYRNALLELDERERKAR